MLQRWPLVFWPLMQAASHFRAMWRWAASSFSHPSSLCRSAGRETVQRSGAVAQRYAVAGHPSAEAGDSREYAFARLDFSAAARSTSFWDKVLTTLAIAKCQSQLLSLIYHYMYSIYIYIYPSIYTYELYICIYIYTYVYHIYIYISHIYLSVLLALKVAMWRPSPSSSWSTRRTSTAGPTRRHQGIRRGSSRWLRAPACLKWKGYPVGSSKDGWKFMEIDDQLMKFKYIPSFSDISVILSRNGQQLL